MWKITISQYLQITDALLIPDHFDKWARILSIITGKSEAHFINELTADQFKKQIKMHAYLVKTAPSPKLRKYFWLKGKLYKVTSDITQLTGGQYCDLMTLCKDPDETLSNIHNILAVLCRPVFSKYNPETFHKTSQVFYKHLTMDKAYPLALFFCALYKNLIPVIKNYLEQDLSRLNETLNQYEAEMNKASE